MRNSTYLAIPSGRKRVEASYAADVLLSQPTHEKVGELLQARMRHLLYEQEVEQQTAEGSR